MRRFKIGTRFFMLFGFMLLTLLFVEFSAYRGLTSIKDYFHEFYEESYEQKEILNKLRIDIYKLENDFLKESNGKLNENDFEETLVKIEENLGLLKTDVGQMNELESAYNSLKNNLNIQNLVESNEIITILNDIESDMIANGKNYINLIEDEIVENFTNNAAIIVVSIIVGIILAFFTITSINKPLKKLMESLNRLALGDTCIEIDLTGKDEVNKLSVALNKTLESIKYHSKNANEVALGNTKLEIKSLSNADTLGKSMSKMTSNINNLLGDINQLTTDHENGHMSTRLVVDRYDGSYKELAIKVNQMVESYIQLNLYSIDIFKELSNGNFDVTIKDLPGDQYKVTETIQMIKNQLIAVSNEINLLVNEANQGKLNVRGNVSDYEGDWKIIISNVNKLFHNIEKPINEVRTVLEEVSIGNLNSFVEGEYNGIFEELKNSMNKSTTNILETNKVIEEILQELSNSNLDIEPNYEFIGDYKQIENSLLNIIETFNKLMSKLYDSSYDLGKMANDVNDDANRLSSGTTQQAASIEEISVTINQVSTQVIENEKMVSKVNDNARKSVLDAMESNKLMSEMTTAMTEIQNSSQSIQKVLKMINDIAFQTNILSLNAAVEAARAGQHGKGFAVIAEDVRNLAMKSATAADDTNIMLEEIINKVNLGKELSEDTAKSLKNILNGNEQNSRMMSEVAKATDEQKQSMTQISKSINEVSDGVNISSANANKSSLTAQSLEIQSKELLDLVSKFTLKNNT